MTKMTKMTNINQRYDQLTNQVADITFFIVPAYRSNQAPHKHAWAALQQLKASCLLEIQALSDEPYDHLEVKFRAENRPKTSGLSNNGLYKMLDAVEVVLEDLDALMAVITKEHKAPPSFLAVKVLLRNLELSLKAELKP